MYVNICICMYMYALYQFGLTKCGIQRLNESPWKDRNAAHLACLVSKYMYGVACVSRIDKIIGLFSKRAL